MLHPLRPWPKGITTAYSSRCVPTREYLFDFCLEGRGEDAAPTKPSISPDTWASFTFHHTQHQRFAMNHIVGAASPPRECLLDFWLKKFTPRFCPKTISILAKDCVHFRQRLHTFSAKIDAIFRRLCNMLCTKRLREHPFWSYLRIGATANIDKRKWRTKSAEGAMPTALRPFRPGCTDEPLPYFA